LNGHKEVSEAFPGYISSGSYELIEFFNTHVPRGQTPKMIGKMVGRNNLKIKNFAYFLEFIKKRYINIKAYNERRVYDKELLDEQNILKEENITNAISEYLKKGITILYKNCTTIRSNQIMISNLPTLLEDLKTDFLMLGYNEKPKHLLEALIMNVLERYSFGYGLPITDQKHEQKTDSLFPIILKDTAQEDISIFSNEIENYLAEGAIYRFFRCLCRVFLNERGIATSKIELENISKEILFKVVSKNLPREADSVVRYLPALFSEMGSKVLLK